MSTNFVSSFPLLLLLVYGKVAQLPNNLAVNSHKTSLWEVSLQFLYVVLS